MDCSTLAQVVGVIELQKSVALFLALAVIQIVVPWSVSKLIAPHAATFQTALKYYASLLVFDVATFILAVFYIRIQHVAGGALILLMLIVLVVLVIGNFAIAMKVYDLEFLGALGFVLLTGLINGGFSGAARYYLGFGEAKSFDVLLEKISRAQQSNATPTPVPPPTPASTLTPAPVPVPKIQQLPAEVTLIEPVQIDLVIDGRSAGAATLPRGAQVKLISIEGDLLKIQYMETITTIPRKSTDFPVKTP